MTFSDEEMIKALERLGYIVKTEKEMFLAPRYGNSDSEEERMVINIYHKVDDRPLAEWAGAGNRRLEYVFKQELNRKILSLF